MWKKISNKKSNLVLSLVSLVYGIELLLCPTILQEYKVYHLLDHIFNQKLISLVFITLGLLKMIGLILDHKLIKRWSLVLLTFFWTLFGVSFLMSEPPNTIWIFSLAMALMSVCIAIEED